MTRRPALIAVAALALVAAIAAAAAFGTGEADAGAEARAKGAVAVPADALAYASVSMDRSGAAWQGLEALAARVPGGAEQLDELEAKMGEGEEAAVLDALGGDISVGLLGVELAGGEPTADAVLVATAADAAALQRELVEMGFAEGPALAGTATWEQGAFAIAIDGQTAIGATSRATLREALAVRAGEAPALADEAAFRATVAKLPDEPLALAYLSPARLAPLAQAAAALMPEQGADGLDLPAATGQLDELVGALGDVRGLGIAVRAEQDGLRVAVAGDADEEALAARGARIPEAFQPTIVDRVPADAAGFAAFRDLGPQLLAVVEQLEQGSPQMAGYVDSIEQATGLDLRADVVPALTGQHAAVLRAGDDTPRGGLILLPPNPAAAGETLARATSFLDAAELLEGAGGEKLGMIGDVAVTWQRGGAAIAVGNDPGLAGVPQTPMADDPAYRAARAAAGTPDLVTGLAWLDGAELRRMAERKAAEQGEQLPAALDAVEGVVAWGEPGGATLFIAVG